MRERTAAAAAAASAARRVGEGDSRGPSGVRDFSACREGVLGGLRVGTSENDSDKTFIPFCAPRNTPTIERHGAPPGFTYREGRGATSLPPTSREERLRDEHSKEKKDHVVRATGSL